MKEFLKLFLGVFVLWGLLYLFINHSGCSNKNDKTEIITKTDTIVRVKINIDTFYRDTGSIKVIPYFVQLPTVIDTPASIIDYYTFKSVQDSFSGKNYKVLLMDTLYMNSLHARRATISVTQVDSIITNTITLKDKPKIKGFAGLSYSTNTEFDKNYLFINGGLQTKRENIWMLGYDPFNKQLQGTYLLKIKLK